VRYLPDRSGVACKDCLGITEKEERAARAEVGKLYGYQCIACRYRFTRSLRNVPEVCPQCAAREFVRFETEKLTADNLLKAADDPSLERLDRTA
jgi:DNA-directed RNA polymerase subunit RPC12/RpoP